MAARDERFAENQRSFRRANERLQGLVEVSVDGHKVPFLCECADGSCMGRIELSTSDYYAIHLDRSQYIILRGHLRIEGEEIVGEEDGYQIASKS